MTGGSRKQARKCILGPTMAAEQVPPILLAAEEALARGRTCRDDDFQVAASFEKNGEIQKRN
jgi:hypothetical protein